MVSNEQIKASLVRANEIVTQDPSRAQNTSSNTAVITGGETCHVTEGTAYMSVDLPRSMGGNNHGMSPTMVLRSAFTSCIAVGIKLWAARMDTIVDSVEVTLETKMDFRGQFGLDGSVAPGFLAANLHIDIRSKADEQHITDVINTSLKHSPLMDIFQRSLHIETKITQ